MTVRINHADSNHPFSYFVPEEPDNLANWADGEWATVDGKYRVHVGGSSADTPLEKDIPLNFKLNKDNNKDNRRTTKTTRQQQARQWTKAMAKATTMADSQSITAMARSNS